MVFDDIDLSTASLNEVKEMELGHVAIQLMAMGMSKRLCSLEGREVIAEFQMSGDLQTVAGLLDAYSQKLENTEMTEEIREEIIKRKERLIKYRSEADSDDTDKTARYEELLEAVKTRDPDVVLATALKNNSNPDYQDIKLRQDALHDAKVCECYTN
jgi:hypothetical protein